MVALSASSSVNPVTSGDRAPTHGWAQGLPRWIIRCDVDGPDLSVSRAERHCESDGIGSV